MKLPDNLHQMNDMDGLIKKIKYGTLDASFDLHNGQVVAVRFYGQRSLLYNRSEKDQNNSEQAVKDIITRIAQSLQHQDVSQITFQVKTHGGKIKNVIWFSEVKKRYNLK